MPARAHLLAAALAASLLVGHLATGATLPGASPDAAAALARGEWPAYAGTYASAKYSPLDQIHRGNVARLQVAWRWASPDADLRRADPSIDPSFMNESTPIMVAGTLYTSTSLSQVAAVDALTGKTRWVFDPGVHRYGTPANLGWLHRGVAYWRDGDDERVIMLTAHGFMLALDAKTGRVIPTFGDAGRVDLTLGLGRPVARTHYTQTSPPVIVRDVIVVGSSVVDFPFAPDMPPGDVRGFDVRTGKPRWTFRSVPGPGEVGHESWENDSWKVAGNTNVWTLMSADEELGYVYLPFGTPANDYYGGHRHGDNLFGETLVCVDARTGRRVWHYQIVRHGLWDYDLPAAPVLADVVRDGRRVKAVIQATKQGFVFVLDRETGASLWPIEDRAVPPSTVPGEKASPTQPFPTKPAPVEIQGVRQEDLIDLTPELKRQAVALVERFRIGPLYTPPSEFGTIIMPGVAGGPSWAGGAWDPETGTYYVTTIRVPSVLTVFRPSRVTSNDTYAGRFTFLPGPEGLPLFKPPWASLVAIDMTTGDHRWRAAVGNPSRSNPVLTSLEVKERLGWPLRSFALATRSLLVVMQTGYHRNPRPSPTTPYRLLLDLHNRDPKLFAYDKTTGALLAEVRVPANATGAPMTYLAGGKQHIVFPVGGGGIPEELIALTLP